MKTYTYIIVGGGLAGGKAVEGIRALKEGGRIALVTQEPRRPYVRPPLSKGYLLGKRDEASVYVAESDYYDKHNVDLMTGVRATALHPDEHTLELDNGESLGYESLLLATGGRARRLPLPGSDLAGVFTLRTLDDSTKIRQAQGPNSHALILGGSFIGSEVAAGLSMMGSDVTMVFPESRLLERVVPEAMSAFIQQIYAEHNVRILAGITPERFIGDTQVRRAELSNGAVLDIDMAVMGVGIDLNTELAAEAGLELRDGDQALLVDEQLQTSVPDIYAAGDIAAWSDVNFDKRLRVEHWDVARAQGLQAGRNMAGAGETYDVIPYFFSDLFDLSFEVWGDLSDWDDTVLRGDLAARSAAFYYFHDGKLVGVLAMGRPDEEREPMQALVKAQPDYDAVAQDLADASKSLTDLA
jgi:NADPH-dependent 2,4-dienoyl-CoA reductase/sulfur reductase-like enzyme